MDLNSLKKIDLKGKILVSLAVLFFFVGGISYFVIYPTVNDINKMSADIDAQRIDLEKKYVRGQSLNKLTNNLKRVEPKMNMLDEIFISQNRALEFVTTLEGIASKNNVDQKINLMTDRSSAEFNYTKTPLSIVITGSFPNIYNYLADLEGLNYYINLNSIDIVKLEAGKSSAQVLAYTYWR